MNNTKKLSICPVCHMQVDTPGLEAIYLGVQYAYCSEQCKARFIANPGLYVGRPGEKSPKQQGKQIFKTRIIKLNTPIDPIARTAILLALYKLMGIKRILVNKTNIMIEYDLMEATEKLIVRRLLDCDAGLEMNLTENIKHAFIDIFEDIQIAALEVPQSGYKDKCH